MICYNQASYITECLEGIFAQQTNFIVEVVISDDLSTDNTREVIRSCIAHCTNPNIIIRELNNSENLGVIGNFFTTLKSCQGEFISICEGDDYWTDPHKLRKQLSLIKTDPSIGLVHTHCQVLNDKTGELRLSNVPEDNITFDRLILGNRVQTLTTLFRRQLLERCLEDLATRLSQWLMGDFPLWLYFSLNAKVGFLPDITAVYRVQEETASHTKDPVKAYKFFCSDHEIKLFFYHFASLNNPPLLQKINETIFLRAIAQNDIKTIAEGLKQDLSPKWRIILRISRIVPLSTLAKLIIQLRQIVRNRIPNKCCCKK